MSLPPEPLPVVVQMLGLLDGFLERGPRAEDDVAQVEAALAHLRRGLARIGQPDEPGLGTYLIVEHLYSALCGLPGAAARLKG